LTQENLIAARDRFAIAASDLLAAIDAHVAATAVATTSAGPVVPQIDTNTNAKSTAVAAERAREAAAGAEAIAANNAAKAAKKKSK
jgi:hypothetical protein